MPRTWFVAVLIAWCGAVRAETVIVATYNVEHFQEHFLAHDLAAKLPKEVADPALKELLAAERHNNDKANWEVAQVIADPAFSPDVLAIEEGPSQSNLDYFNKRWLDGAYETAITFPTNTGDRQQNLCLLLKPGFKVLEKRDQHYLDKDPVPNPRGDRLFARGPGFCLVQSPGGFRFWVGVTHQKSKVAFLSDEEVQKIRDANPGATRQRINDKIAEAKAGRAVEDAGRRDREARRTHEIMKELAAAGTTGGTAGVVLLGDMNDEIGLDDAEKQAGADAVAGLVGPAADGFVLATKPLVDKGEFSFGGYWKTDHRSLIDHVVVTPALKDRVREAQVFKGGLTRVASDHYPVFVKLQTDGPAAGALKDGKPSK